MIYTIKDMTRIAPLYQGWEETIIWSCLDGCMGQAYADALEAPKSAKIVNADFIFFAGEPDRELVVHRHTDDTCFAIMIAREEEWYRLIEAIYGGKAVRRQRYAVKKEPDVFDEELLTGIAGSLPEEFELRMIDEELFNQTKEFPWAGDLTSQFASFEDYEERGVGEAVVKDGVLVAGASSYTVYKSGIEIEIDTREDFRRRGLASACGAGLILECRKRGLYPSWDAQNKGSLALAEKLGYHADEEYAVYEVTLECR